MLYEEITGEILCAMEAHSEFGFGLLESACQKCLKFELGELGFDVKSLKSGIRRFVL